jgi:adenylyltransferase/sulfurtransferase
LHGEPHLTAFSSVAYDLLQLRGGHYMSFVITPKELKDRLDKGDKLVLLDVREPWENQIAKLDNSILIPLGTLPNSLSKLDRNAEIIAYCHHGMRSGDATGFLLQQGFSNVKNLIGGIDAWSVQIDGAIPRY